MLEQYRLPPCGDHQSRRPLQATNIAILKFAQHPRTQLIDWMCRWSQILHLCSFETIVDFVFVRLDKRRDSASVLEGLTVKLTQF